MNTSITLSSASAPRAVLFDLGDTVLHFDHFDADAGIHELYTRVEDTKGVSEDNFRQAFTKLNLRMETCRNTCCSETRFAMLTNLVLDRFGIRIALGPEAIEREFWKASHRMSPAPDIRECLRGMQDLSLIPAVLSNSMFPRAVLEWELKRHRMLNAFAFVMSSADYGISKPAKPLFEAAAGKLGLQPQQIWFVGDRYDTDIAGAVEAGMTAILYTGAVSTQSPDATVPHAVIHSFSELHTLLTLCPAG